MKMFILPLTTDRRRVFVIPAKEVMVSFFFVMCLDMHSISPFSYQPHCKVMCESKCLSMYPILK